MMLIHIAEQFAETPVGAVTIPLVSGAILAIAGAMVKMMLDISSLKQTVKNISDDIVEIKTDPDVMRWSLHHNRDRRRRSEMRTHEDGQ